MGSSTYNMESLTSFGEFDAAAAEAGFGDTGAYFSKLNTYMDSWKSFLHDYNPTVVIYSDPVRDDFLKEMREIKLTLESLHMTLSLDELKNLEEAVEKGDPKSLSDGIIKFHATLEIIAERIKAAEEDSAPSSMEKPVVFAVDDDPLALEVIMRMLESDYTVFAHQKGEVAIKAAEKHTPELFLLDIEMPEMNGIELAEKFRNTEQFKNIPIIFITSMASKESVMDAKKLGIKDYLLKPVNSKTLLKKVKDCLESSGNNP